MVAAGNWTGLDEAREHSFYVDATMRVTLARLAEDSAREKLTRLLGLAASSPARIGAPALQLADRLPELPQRMEDLPDVEHIVLENRIDLRMMRMHIDELARSLKLTKSTRFVNVLDMGATRVKQGSQQDPFESGLVLTLEVPIFDSGAARIRKAEAVYAQAVNRFAQAAIEARSQVRQSYAAYRAAFDLAVQQRDEVVPLRKTVAQQKLLRYNASLISIFELLADAREQIASVDGYIQALRDFWIAKSEFDARAARQFLPLVEGNIMLTRRGFFSGAGTGGGGHGNGQERARRASGHRIHGLAAHSAPRARRPTAAPIARWQL